MDTENTRFIILREAMVSSQIAKKGITHPDVLHAMKKVPRHLFVSKSMVEHAYKDTPLPIGYGQTISQPYIVGLMTSLLCTEGIHKVLEIGTGCGYQTAVLSEIFREVHSLEILKPLFNSTKKNLKSLGYNSIYLYLKDGNSGLSEKAPFDAILAAASPENIPPPLLDQVRDGGRIIIPIGKEEQSLFLFEKKRKNWFKKEICKVKFVPMVRIAENQ